MQVGEIFFNCHIESSPFIFFNYLDGLMCPLIRPSTDMIEEELGKLNLAYGIEPNRYLARERSSKTSMTKKVTKATNGHRRMG